MFYKNETTRAAGIALLKTDIANVQTAIAKAGSIDIESYSIGGRSTKRNPVEGKIQLLNTLKKQLRTEERMLAIDAGEGDPGKHKPRF